MKGGEYIIENIINYINLSNSILIPIIYIIGVLLKSFIWFNNKYIPLTLLIIAIVLSLDIYSVYNIQSVAIAIIQGTLITGVAVLIHQIIKQMIFDKPFFSVAEKGNGDQRGDIHENKEIDNSEIKKDVSKFEENNYLKMSNACHEGEVNRYIKIYLDAGHGGNDPGLVHNGYKEKDLNLEAVIYIGNRLSELGFEVGYSRTTDINAGGSYVRGIKAKGYNYFLSLHCNAGGGIGTEIIANCKEIGALVQSHYQREFSTLGGVRKIYSRKYSKDLIVTRTIANNKFTHIVNDLDWYGVLRGSWSVGVTGDIIELFFLDNVNDLNNYLLKKKDYWEAIIKSICFTYGVEYKDTIVEIINEDFQKLQEQINDLNQVIKGKDNIINSLQNELAQFVPITLYEKNNSNIDD